MNITFYDLYYTVIKNKDDNKIVKNKNEDEEKDCINYDDFIIPNHYIGQKIDIVMVR